MGRNKSKNTSHKNSSHTTISTAYCSNCRRQFQSQSNRGAFRLKALHELRCEAVPVDVSVRQQQYLSFIKSTLSTSFITRHRDF